MRHGPGRARALAGAALLVALVAAPVPGPAAQGDVFLVVIAGIGGDADYRQLFVDQAVQLSRAATTAHGLPGEHVITLVGHVELAPEVADGRSDRQGIEAAFDEVARRSVAGDQVIVVLIGHGTARGGEARFNIPGPDLGPADLDLLLDRLDGRLLALVNTTSASGPFLPVLSGPRRVVVTATRSERERDETRFGRHFVEAFTDLAVDLDKDGRVSVLEAFRHANREVERYYEGGNRLRTEHALLDDDGDGEGTEAPEPGADGDGALASRIGLGSPALAGAAEDAGEESPEVGALRAERRALQGRLDTLRARRDEMAEAEYLGQLEELLLELARIDERLRQLTGEES